MEITIQDTRPVTCDECGHDTFTEVLKLRTVSKFLTGQELDSIVPIHLYACIKCNHVNEQFIPAELKTKEVLLG